MANTVLITGAAGWLGGLVRISSKLSRVHILTLSSSQLATALHNDPLTPDVHLILADIIEPKAPAGSKAVAIKADLGDKIQIEALFATKFGIPDTIYCLHGIMSRGSEDNFELGVKVCFFLPTFRIQTDRVHCPDQHRLRSFSSRVDSGPWQNSH